MCCLCKVVIQVCSPSEICRLPALYGLCQGSTSRFFFNELSGRCEPFTYSGCGGNRNNFETLNDCIEECGKCIYHFYYHRGIIKRVMTCMILKYLI